MSGASFCIGTILGTYQSDRKTTVNFVNCRQPSIITLHAVLAPARIPSQGFYSNSLIMGNSGDVSQGHCGGGALYCGPRGARFN